MTANDFILLINQAKGSEFRFILMAAAILPLSLSKGIATLPAYHTVILIVQALGAPFEYPPFLLILLRLIVIIYQVSIAAIGFDQRRLPA